MSIQEKLELLVSMDPSQGVRAFDQLAGKAEEASNRTESALSRAGASMLKLGASGLGVGALLTEMGSKEQAASPQENYGHTAVETQNALATLTLSYNDTGKALDAMQLVADLAAKKHESLGEAATQVAKAHGGAARLFKEFGIQVQQNTDGTKNYDGALAELAQKLQGQASASTDTFMGKLGALKAKVEDNVAAFGEKWGPSIMAASGLLAAAGPAASAMGTALEKLRAARLADAEAATGEAVAAGLANVALGVGFVAAGASAVYVLHELFSGQTQTAGATQDYTQAIQQQTGSLVANVDAVTSQKLASSDAARAANDAGVSYRTMADAV